MEKITQKADISLKNLSYLKGKEESVDLRIKAHLRELAHAVSALMPKGDFEDEGEEFRRAYLEICGQLSFEKRAELCLWLASEYPKSYMTKRLWGMKNKKDNATAVYVKNPLCDIAFIEFSEAFKKLQVYYADDFESALEDVYYSKADYVILPVSSSKNGKLLHFCELILRYEMKACMSCNVHSNTDESENRFYLLAKNAEDRKGTHLEFLLSEPSENLPKLLYAAQKYGCSYISSYTAPENEYAIVELDVSNANADALCLCLFLEFPRHIPIGIYN